MEAEIVFEALTVLKPRVLGSAQNFSHYKHFYTGLIISDIFSDSCVGVKPDLSPSIA
jgi:hypothetical protein